MVHTATATSADDLSIFMLDLIAAASGRQWLAPTLVFFNAYDNAPVIAQLSVGASEAAWPRFGGRSNKFRKSREGETASPKDCRRGR
jgi:hypothetical protein